MPLKAAPRARAKVTRAYMQHADAASLGIEMGACVGVGYLLGSWLDGELASGPWLLVFFVLCGFGAAMKAVLRVVKRAQRTMAAPVDHVAALTAREAEST